MYIMATRQENQKGVAEEKLRQKLAIAVKTIQWSYAIFWSISSTQPGVLEWGDGYYNGDIKTRKTVQAGELASDECLGLPRTEQLRELFESLYAAERNPQATTKRPCAALSPEDLTDTEWYFLVCMSFIFNLGQGLPGRSLANNKTIWLSNAQTAGSKVFSRTLLAKSASIETVVCFPYLGGILEFGVTEKVREDHNIIHRIKASFSEIPYQKFSKISSHVSENTRSEKEFDCTKLNFDLVDNNLDQMVECEEGAKICSPENSSNGPQPYPQAEESLVVEGLNVGGSQSIDDEVSNGDPTSMSSSDCISQNLTSPEMAVSIANKDKATHVKRSSVDRRSEDAHYQSVLSTLFKSTNRLSLGSHLRNCNRESVFVSWKRGSGLCEYGKRISQGGTSQVILKKALYEVAKMHGHCLLEWCENKGRGQDRLWRPKTDNGTNALLERKRREKISQMFSILGSLVPSTGKTDKVSVLDGTIEYLKELEKRVEELETGKGKGESEAIMRKKPHERVETTSDNYDENNVIANSKKPSTNKRKADCDLLDVMEMENGNQALSKYISTDHTIIVSITGKNALIEIRCPCRENLLLEILDATSNLHLDSHSIQSSTGDGILSLSIESKLKGCTLESARIIKQALQRVIVKC